MRVLGLVVVVLGSLLAAPAAGVTTGSISGVVIDQDGMPVAGVQVNSVTTTGVDGQYVIDGLDGGDTHLFMRLPRGFGAGAYHSTCLDYDCVSLTVDVPESGTVEVRTTVFADALVEGRISASDTGEGFGDVCLVVWETLVDICRTTSAGDGSYEVYLPARVPISWGMYQSRPYGYGNFSYPAEGRVTYEPGERIQLDVALLPTPSVRGQVVDRFGRPGTARVFAERPAFRGVVSDGPAETDDDGAFFLADLIARDYEVVGFTEIGRGYTTRVPVDLQVETQTSGIDLVIESGVRGAGTTDPSGIGPVAETPIVVRSEQDRFVTAGFGLGHLEDGFAPLGIEARFGYVRTSPGDDTGTVVIDRSLLPTGMSGDIRVSLDTLDAPERTFDGDVAIFTISLPDRPTGGLFRDSQERNLAFGVPIESQVDGWEWLATMVPDRGPGGTIWRTEIDLRSAAMGGDFTFTYDQDWFEPSVTSGYGPALFDARVDTRALAPGEHTVTLTITDGLGHTTRSDITVTIEG